MLAALSPARVEERTKALAKPLARKERKALQAIGARMSTLPPPAEWRRAILEGAARAGLAGRRRSGGGVRRAVAAAGARMPLAQALTTFAVSDDFRVLRRDMGLKG